jgi:hypothetical protein
MITTIDLLKSGFALIPIPYGTKGPMQKGWNFRESVITGPAQASELIGKNIGLAHAYCSPEPTYALDIDDYRYSEQWLQKRGINLLSLLDRKDSVVISSGKKFSLKLIGRLPRHHGVLESKKINTPDGTSALEFRCATRDGLTVQDVIPPSRHPSGTNYEYLGKGNPLEPPYIGDDLLQVWLDVLTQQKSASRPNPCPNLRIPSTAIPETPRKVAEVVGELNCIDADCPYEIWRDIVWAILSTGWDCAEDIAEKWSVAAPHRYSSTAFWDVVNSYDPYRSNAITVATIFFHARRGRQPWQAS